jgi:hypothetical protein
MFLIFGYKQGTPQPDPAGMPVTGQCPVCGHTGTLQPVKAKRHISLFFIPLIPVGAQRGTQCQNCGAMLNA